MVVVIMSNKRRVGCCHSKQIGLLTNRSVSYSTEIIGVKGGISADLFRFSKHKFEKREANDFLQASLEERWS